jgi:hypothetical protein
LGRSAGQPVKAKTSGNRAIPFRTRNAAKFAAVVRGAER